MPQATYAQTYFPGLLGEASSYPISPAELAASARSVRRRGDASVTAAFEQLRAGGMVVLAGADEPIRAAVLTAAQFAGPAEINSMSTHARGPMYLAVTAERSDALGLARTASVTARHGITCGISAADQARTVAVAIDPHTTGSDLTQPGHVFPARACEGGVRLHAGLAEAAVDLTRMAGLFPAGVYCPIIDAAGALAGAFELETFCHETGAQMVSVEDLLAYRLRHERRLGPGVEAQLPTTLGGFSAVAYESSEDGGEHLALIKGDLQTQRDVVVSVHTRCVGGDLFGSLRCDCRARLDQAMRDVEAAGAGAVIYLGHSHCPAEDALGASESLSAIAAGPVFSAAEAGAVAREILRDLRIASARYLNLPTGIDDIELAPSGTLPV